MTIHDINKNQNPRINHQAELQPAEFAGSRMIMDSIRFYMRQALKKADRAFKLALGSPKVVVLWYALAALSVDRRFRSNTGKAWMELVSLQSILAGT